MEYVGYSPRRLFLVIKALHSNDMTKNEQNLDMTFIEQQQELAQKEIDDLLYWAKNAETEQEKNEVTAPEVRKKVNTLVTQITQNTAEEIVRRLKMERAHLNRDLELEGIETPLQANHQALNTAIKIINDVNGQEDLEGKD